LLIAEKEGRKTIESLKPKVEDLREQLQTNRHEYGRAGISFLQDLSEIDEQIKSYSEFVDAGDYFQAQQTVQEIEEALSKLTTVLEQFPELLETCEQEVPSALDKLLQGVREMQEADYHINAKGYEEEIRTLKLHLRECVNQLTADKIDETQTVLAETKKR